MLAITISEDKLTLDDGVTEIITRIDSESPKKMQGYVDHLNNSRKISEAIPIDDEHPIVKFAVENGVTDAVAKVQASVESWRGLARMDAVLLTLRATIELRSGDVAAAR